MSHRDELRTDEFKLYCFPMELRSNIELSGVDDDAAAAVTVDANEAD